MVLPAQFQLGLELTNIVNPISQAVSAVGSLALVDAIRKSGSDAITEMKLASFIGRHIIDPAMKLHFREAVAKSDQSVISRYLDIILESGSGPTVQEAMKNPALLSMVIQLSGLAFAHEDESLASAIVEAMERIVRESDADTAIVPDYVALLGTLRACQQQTAGFRWASVYEAVEHKIGRKFDNGWTLTNRGGKRRKLDNPGVKCPVDLNVRCLPFPVLQALLMWLNSLQKFPEHRVLHLRCDRGVSTIVVWCYHVLGLSAKVKLGGTSICFGKEPSNILIEGACSKDVGASLMDPADPHEPLFTLANADDDLEIGYEYRAEAYGFGQVVLKNAGLTDGDKQYCLRRIIADCIARSEDEKGLYNYPCEDSIIRAYKFLFGLETADVEALREDTGGLLVRDSILCPRMLPRLAAMLIAFARIQEQDLERCRSMPLSLNTLSSLRIEEHPEINENLGLSFEKLAHVLLGHMSSTEYVANAVLVSAWGWSIFLDIIDAADPSDASYHIRVMGGVPSRRGVRRARIIDGPTDMDPNPSEIPYNRGMSSGERGIIMVGHHSDAFQITQIFTWTPALSKAPVIRKFGFREMQELCNKTEQLPSCECAPISSDIVEQIDACIEKRPFWKTWVSVSERVIGRRHLEGDRKVFDNTYLVYVSDSAAARWLQLDDMHSASQEGISRVLMRGFDTCIECAMACRLLDLGIDLCILL